MLAAPLLITTPDRVFYRGPLGQPRLRRFAATACYVALGGELSWALSKVRGGGALLEGRGRALWVAPGLGHQIAVNQGPVLCYLIEPDFHDIGVAPSRRFLPDGADGAELALWLERLISLDVADLMQRCADGGDAASALDTELDLAVFGGAVLRRPLDARIVSVVEVLRRDPACAWQASDAASHCQLSASRFMHLFKAELGMGWRDFRAWTRARALLARVHTDDNLTQVALSLGYPDGTHFSHAIRQITGLRPRDIIEGSRNLSVWSESGVSPA